MKGEGRTLVIGLDLKNPQEFIKYKKLYEEQRKTLNKIHRMKINAKSKRTIPKVITLNTYIAKRRENERD